MLRRAKGDEKRQERAGDAREHCRASMKTDSGNIQCIKDEDERRCRPRAPDLSQNRHLHKNECHIKAPVKATIDHQNQFLTHQKASYQIRKLKHTL